MWTVAAILGGITAEVSRLGLRFGGHPALSLHSSNEPDDSTINVVVVIIIIIIIFLKS